MQDFLRHFWTIILAISTHTGLMGGLEINIGDSDGADEVARRSGDNEEDIAEQEVERRFRQALEAMPAPEMWTKYLVWLAEGVEEEEDNAAKMEPTPQTP